MVENRVSMNHVHHLLLFKYKEGLTGARACREINGVYPSSVSSSSVQRWFKKFSDGDESLERKEGKTYFSYHWSLNKLMMTLF
jgi:hypothetical protein